MSLHHPQTTVAFRSDDEVLDYVFDVGNDFSLPQELDAKVLDNKPKMVIQTAQDINTEAQVLGLTESELQAMKNEELRAIRLVTCDNPDFKQSEEIFNDIIKKHPLYASALNNRAQLFQLYALSIERSTEDIPDKAKLIKKYRLMAFSDLNQAIMTSYDLYPLFSPKGAEDLLRLQKDPNATIVVPRVLIQALCQRGLLHRLRGNDRQSFGDFKQAASLGSKIAQKEVISLNPIAQLNQEIVAEIMQEWIQQPTPDTESTPTDPSTTE